MNAQLNIFLQLAETLASKLLPLQCVTGVGIFGSTARGIPKECNTCFGDIDMAVFVDDVYIATPLIRGYSSTSTLTDLLWQLPGFGETLYDELVTTMGRIRVQFIVLPMFPEDRFVANFCRRQKDPNFLDNIFTDMKMFDPNKMGFGPVGNFPLGWFSIAQTSYFPPQRDDEDRWVDDLFVDLERMEEEEHAKNETLNALAQKAGKPGYTKNLANHL